MPRFRVAIPAVVAVDIEARSAEEAIRIARERQGMMANIFDANLPLPGWGEGAALWPAALDHSSTAKDGAWLPEIWDEVTEEAGSDVGIGPSDEEDMEAAAERADYAREAERAALRDAGRLR